MGTPNATSIQGMILPENHFLDQAFQLPECLGNHGANAGKSGSLVFSAENAKEFILLTDMNLAAAGANGETNFKCFETHIYPEFRKVCRPLNYKQCSSNFGTLTVGPGLSGQICTKLDKDQAFRCEKK